MVNPIGESNPYQDLGFPSKSIEEAKDFSLQHPQFKGWEADDVWKKYDVYQIKDQEGSGSSLFTDKNRLEEIKNNCQERTKELAENKKELKNGLAEQYKAYDQTEPNSKERKLVEDEIQKIHRELGKIKQEAGALKYNIGICNQFINLQ